MAFRPIWKGCYAPKYGTIKQTRLIMGRAFLFVLFLQSGMKQERVTIGELPIKQPLNLFIFILSKYKVTLDIKANLAYTKYWKGRKTKPPY